MILCIVDDLFFSIKIKNAAKLLGADVYFERAPELVLDTIREKAPRLVIFDLDSVKMKPLEALAGMQADAALKHIPTLGFVSHVNADLIAAARDAGAGQVLARSAFVAQLGSILQPAGPPQP